MSMTFASGNLRRCLIAIGLFATVRSTTACGSDSSTVAGSGTAFDGGTAGAGGLFGTGGLFAPGGFATAGAGGAGPGGAGAGGAGVGGLIAAGGAASGGGTNPDGGVDGAAGGTAGDATVCVVPSQPLDVSNLPACAVPSLDQCVDGKCFPTSAIPAGSQDLLADCDATNKCVPELFIQYVNQFLVDTCTSVNGAEGRCLSLCIPQVADQSGFLPKDGCKDSERCAPCFDPRTGADTGACHQGCDPGPTEPPKVFDKCCSDHGSCVPKSIVPASDLGQLGADTCTDATQVCAPDKLSDSTYTPPKCISLAGLEGRCLADCLPAVAAQKDRLPQATCEAGELCAPCYDPITGADTGACTRNGDTPTDPPTTFPTCCGDLGHCVPSSILTTAQQSQLGTDTCSASGDLCAPDVFAVAGQTPDPCRALGTFDAEGRCIPACVPSVAAQADRLAQATCDAGYLCAPCYDPITGADTGACTQNGDVPSEPTKTFANCCGGQGSCVPTSIVPVADQGQLGKDTCSTGELCAPDKLSDPAYVPKTCDSIGGAEGRCLADCLPAIAAQASRLPRDVCDAGELCAPCYDPITAADTGACTRGTDTPKEPPYLFDQCCNDLGHCVPKTVLTTAQQSQLGADTCASSGDLCAPDVFAVAGQQAEACRSLGTFDAEGRCIPSCVPSVAAQASRLTQGTCPANTLCAPCYDPITGLDTSACTQNGDSPKEPSKTFPKCCGGLGTCVPSTLVPADQASQLGKDSCSGAGDLCAPTKLTDPAVKPTSCRAPGDMEARCLPACLPPIQAQAANLRQQTCATGELCAPCYNPLDGTDTGACRLNGDVPAEPAVKFAGCCPYPLSGGTTRGTCVPPELVSAAQAASLPLDTCSTGFLCAPNLKVNDQSAKFPPCQLPVASLACTPPIFNFGCEGGCVPDCIVDPAQKGFLAQGTCAAGELCAPCVDPLSGARTGSCD